MHCHGIVRSIFLLFCWLLLCPTEGGGNCSLREDGAEGGKLLLRLILRLTLLLPPPSLLALLPILPLPRRWRRFLLFRNFLEILLWARRRLFGFCWSGIKPVATAAVKFSRSSRACNAVCKTRWRVTLTCLRATISESCSVTISKSACCISKSCCSCVTVWCFLELFPIIASNANIVVWALSVRKPIREVVVFLDSTLSPWTALILLNEPSRFLLFSTISTTSFVAPPYSKHAKE